MRRKLGLCVEIQILVGTIGEQLDSRGLLCELGYPVPFCGFGMLRITTAVAKFAKFAFASRASRRRATLLLSKRRPSLKYQPWLHP